MVNKRFSVGAREERIKNLIKTWHHKASEEDYIFSKFIFLWFCFNAWLAYKSNESNDRCMINWLKRTNNYSDIRIAFENIKNPETIDELVKLSPIRRDESHPRQGQDIYISDKNDFDNIVEAIYRIRCNLFHGRKDADDKRDRQLVQACGNILSVWIGKLVEEWKN